MSKANGWLKHDPHEWLKENTQFLAEITKVRLSGYHWAVYSRPRPATGRWLPMGSGECAKLKDAKEASDALIALNWGSPS